MPAELRRRLEAIAAAERADPKIDPASGTHWWLHDRRTDRVVLALHGYTNNPRQFAALGPLLHADGHNVIAPRFPFHGYRDRMTEEIAGMRYEDWARAALDFAALAALGGRRIVVVGISATGSIGAWLAAYLPIDVTVALSPFMGVRFFPGPADRLVRTALRSLPDQFIWWDPLREERQLPAHAYPRFSLHALGELLRFGEELDCYRSTEHGRYAALLLNAHEPIVSNAVARSRFAQLERRGVRVESFVCRDFPHRHDVLEPELPGSPDPQVYALVRRLVNA